MLLIYLLLLASTAGAWTKYNVDVAGTVVCDSKNGHVKALLPDVVVQLWEEDSWPLPNDMLNITKSTKEGEFTITGSSKELFGNDFFIEIKVPCWGADVQRCDSKATMCPNANCEYRITRTVNPGFRYTDGEEKKTLLLMDFNVVNKEWYADERKSVCP